MCQVYIFNISSLSIQKFKNLKIKNLYFEMLNFQTLNILEVKLKLQIYVLTYRYTKKADI